MLARHFWDPARPQGTGDSFDYEYPRLRATLARFAKRINNPE